MIDKRGLRRVAHSDELIAVATDERIVAKTHAPYQSLGRLGAIRTAGINALYRHAVERERARFVRAYDVGTAERFDRGQFFDYRVLFGQLLYADSHDYGYYRGQALRNSRNGKRDRSHKRIDNAIRSDRAGADGGQYAYNKDKRGNDKHRYRNKFARLVEFAL